MQTSFLSIRYVFIFERYLYPEFLTSYGSLIPNVMTLIESIFLIDFSLDESEESINENGELVSADVLTHSMLAFIHFEVTYW